MTLNLDIRGPLIVLIADFNPAIFKTPWIAKHLFERQEGEEIPVLEASIQAGSAFFQLNFIEGVAVNVSSSRTELFALNAGPETLERVETVLLKMLEVLPHTPLSAIGCNLTYVDDAPSDEINDLFQTPEGFEAEGVLNKRQSGVQLQLADGSVLNFSRTLSTNDARYAFNFHRSETNAERYKDFVPGLIAESLRRSEAILNSLYRYDGHDTLEFMAGIEERKENDVAQAAD